MPNITYYLGAGASFNSIPLYGHFQERLSFFRDYIFHHSAKFNNIKLQPATDYYLTKLKTLIDLLDPDDYVSIDTLAHTIFKKPSDDTGLTFHQLKYLISDFFMFEQLVKRKEDIHFTQIQDIDIVNCYQRHNTEICRKVNNSIDKRYRTFVLPQLNNTDNVIPENINFISWNYDMQMELAYADSLNVSVTEAQKKLQVYPSPSVKDLDVHLKSSFIKLNGTAGIYYKDQNKGLSNFIYEHEIKWKDEFLEEMMETFLRNKTRISDRQPFFKFYFEDPDPIHSEAVKYANLIIKITDVLVIIGYSFHTSNRVIDKAVLEGATNIKKIIVQTDPKDFEGVKHNLINTRFEFRDYIEQYPTLDNFPTPNNIGLEPVSYSIV